jgi:hypothetical protein
MVKKASRKITGELVKLTQRFHTELLSGDDEQVFEELITEESSEILAAVAWPLAAYRQNRLGSILDPELNPFPGMPLPDAWSLAFQMDRGNCRSVLFKGLAEGIQRYQLDRFYPDKAIAFKDKRSVILAADTPGPLLLMPFREDENGYRIDFLVLLLFSMGVRASIFWEAASYAENNGQATYAVEYLRLAQGLKKAYTRINRLMCEHPFISCHITEARKLEIRQEMQVVERASDKLQVLTLSKQASLAVHESLLLKDYEKILQIVTNVAMAMERSPDAFAGLGEEHIRQHLVVQLNGQFPGRVTAETFNYYGKTDILIRRENDNIFVAECKFWKGAAAFAEAIDQLLRYATWRDTRLALFIFNRRRNLSNVLSQISSALKQHPAFLREEAYDTKRGFRAYLAHSGDPEQQLLITILVFDLPNDK